MDPKLIINFAIFEKPFPEIWPDPLLPNSDQAHTSFVYAVCFCTHTELRRFVDYVKIIYLNFFLLQLGS